MLGERRRVLKNLPNQISLLRQCRNSTNRIWIDTSSGGRKSINTNGLIHITNLPFQKSYPPLSSLRNPITLNSENDTFNSPCPNDTNIHSHVARFRLFLTGFRCSSGYRFAMHFLLAFLACYLDSLCFLASFNLSS